MSNEELQELKEQIKQEILKEMKEPKARKETVWSKIKQEFEEEAKLFNYEYDETVTGEYGQKYKRKQEMHIDCRSLYKCAREDLKANLIMEN